MTAQTKKIEFGVYKYEHPNFGPLMLLLDLDDEPEDVAAEHIPSKQSISSLHKKGAVDSVDYRFRDEEEKKIDKILNRYQDGSHQQYESVRSIDQPTMNKKRTLSHRPPIPGKGFTINNNVLIRKGQQAERDQRRRSLEYRTLERQKSHEKSGNQFGISSGGIMLPNIVRKK